MVDVVDRGKSVPREVEIKLELDGKALAEIRRSALLPNAARRTARLVSRYFDTDDQSLRRRGLSFRIRRIGDRFVQTVKAQTSAASGLHERFEWEADVEGYEPDLAALYRMPSAPVIDLAGVGGRLRPIFETDIERTTWQVQRGASSIEVDCDDGSVRAGNVTADISELELELVTGSPVDLFVLAREIAADGSAEIGVRSKSERGYALLARSAPLPVKAPKLAIRAGTSAAEAFKIIARACIRQLRLNQPLVETMKDAEALHQARVALRRLRTALVLFKRLVASEELDGIRKRLGRIFRTLGSARNLDVFIASLREETGDHPTLEALLHRALAARERAYADVLAELASPKQRRLMLDLLAYVELGRWRGDGSPGAGLAGRPVGELTAPRLDKRWRRLCRGKVRLDELPPQKLHRFRIKAKSLRYACEFFRKTIGDPKAPERYRSFVATLAKLQDALGRLNDLETGRALQERLAKRRRHPRGPALDDRLTRELAKRRKRAREEAMAAAVSAHAALKEAKPFW